MNKDQTLDELIDFQNQSVRKFEAHEIMAGIKRGLDPFDAIYLKDKDEIVVNVSTEPIKYFNRWFEENKNDPEHQRYLNEHQSYLNKIQPGLIRLKSNNPNIKTEFLYHIISGISGIRVAGKSSLKRARLPLRRNDQTIPPLQEFIQVVKDWAGSIKVKVPSMVEQDKELLLINKIDLIVEHNKRQLDNLLKLKQACINKGVIAPIKKLNDTKQPAPATAPKLGGT